MAEFEYKELKNQDYKQKIEEMLKVLPKCLKTYVIGIEGRTAHDTMYMYLRRISVFFLNYAISDDINLISKDDLPNFSFADMESITAIDIEGFMHWLRSGNASNGKTVKESTISNYLSSLNSLWDYAQSRGLIKHNVIKDIKRARKQNKEPITLDTDETETVLSEINNGYHLTVHQDNYRKTGVILRDRALMMLLVKTGLRVSELVGINTNDLNLQKHYVRVLRKEGKVVDVYFSDDVQTAITDYLKERDTLKPADTSALFISNMGRNPGTRLSVRSVQLLIKKYAEASLPAKGSEITPHKMRSTYATEMIKRTGDLSLVQHLLSHESPATTSIYIKRDSAEREAHRNDL